MSTNQPIPPESESPGPSPIRKIVVKYFPFIVLLGAICIVVAYRVYNDRTSEDEYYITKVTVASDGGAVLVQKRLRRTQRIDLAHLQVPASTSFQAKCYIEDVIAGREVKIKMLENGGVVFVPEGDLNYSLVRYGLATAEGPEYSKAEARAKKAELGLWHNLGEDQ